MQKKWVRAAKLAPPCRVLIFIHYLIILLLGRKLHKYRTSMSRHVRALWDDYVSEPDGCRLLGSRARRTKDFLAFRIVYLASNTVI